MSLLSRLELLGAAFLALCGAVVLVGSEEVAHPWTAVLLGVLLLAVACGWAALLLPFSSTTSSLLG